MKIARFMTWTYLQQMYHENDHTACLFPAAIAFLDWTPVYCMKQTGTQAKPPADVDYPCNLESHVLNQAHFESKFGGLAQCSYYFCIEGHV